jgi:hypothetical protein
MTIEWTPGIGDPTVTGWLTVVAYFVAAAYSFKAAGQSQLSGRNWKTEGAFWACLAMAMFALGVNKQLDLQSLMTEIARNFAKEGGWYDGRRAVQQIAIGLIAAGAGAGAILMVFVLRNAANEVKVAALGFCLVLAFVLIRAASFHHIDLLLGRDVMGIRWNALLELPGIVVIAACAGRYSSRIRSKGRRAGKSEASRRGR